MSGRSTKASWMKRRWFDFRNGHSIYLIFTMSFVQFVIISYTLAIERFGALEQLFPNMFTWAGVFLGAYIPTAIVIGHMHLTRQLKVETEQQMTNNPFAYKTTPGKEKGFTYPTAVTGLTISNETMRITNDMADGIERMFNTFNEKYDLKLEPLKITRYSDGLFEQNIKWIYVSKGLMNGGDIRELIKEWDSAHPPKD